MLFFNMLCQMSFSSLHFRIVALKPASDKGSNAKWTMSQSKQVTIIITIVIC